MAILVYVIMRIHHNMFMCIHVAKEVRIEITDCTTSVSAHSHANEFGVMDYGLQYMCSHSIPIAFNRSTCQTKRPGSFIVNIQDKICLH